MENEYTYLPIKENSSFLDTLIFSTKIRFNILRRIFKNTSLNIVKHSQGNSLVQSKFQVDSKSLLWNASDSEKNWILTAGKVENLRIACKLLDGLEVEVGQVFSFWKQIGNPNSNKGFTIGREIREGCIIPTIAGGLCQLSNALYDCALKMNMEIVERHRHTKVVKGSLAELDRDATVKWNYIDLRFKSKFKFRIEAELTQDNLVVTFRANEGFDNEKDSLVVNKVQKINDCYSCGNIKCFQHPIGLQSLRLRATKVFLLDNTGMSFEEYITSRIEKDDLILTTQKEWKKLAPSQVKYYSFKFLKKVLFFRRRYTKDVVYKTRLELSEKIAQRLFQKIPIQCRHIIISQNLLPYAVKHGVLGGRTYEVVMSNLPLELIHKRLDFAYSLHPENHSLKNFRACESLLQLERKGLEMAGGIISTNAEIKRLFPKKCLPIKIKNEKIGTYNSHEGDVILFPNNLMARYGANEIVRLSESLQVEIQYLDGIQDELLNKKKAKLIKFKGEWDRVRLVCNPTFVQSTNESILNALRLEIPILTTSASGLWPSNHVTEIEIGNFESFKKEMMLMLNIDV